MNKIIIDNIEYTVDNNSACIVKCAADSVSVVIPSDITVDRVDYPVTTIGYNAFSFCNSLKKAFVSKHTKIRKDSFPEHTEIIRK